MSILIEPVINGQTHGSTIQAQKFSLSLKVTNLSKNPSGEFRITNIRFKSAETTDIVNDWDRKSFLVPSLNPSKEILLEIGEYGHLSYGLVNIVLTAHYTENTSAQITLSQKDSSTGNISELQTPSGEWMDFFYVESISESQQKKVNVIMIYLNTILTFLAVMQTLKLFESEMGSLLSFIKRDPELITSLSTVIISTLSALLAYSFLSKNGSISILKRGNK